MSRFLAIDTATETCSVALIVDEEIHGRYEAVGNRHSAMVLSMVEAVLAEGGLALGDLDALGFSRGPGSFTGVRIGTAVVQGLAFAAELPVIPVSTLALLAATAWPAPVPGRVLAAIDARMGEVYQACYEFDADGAMQRRGEERVCAVADIIVPGALSLATGTGISAWPKEFSALIADPGVALRGDVHPDARAMGPLLEAGRAAGELLAAEQLVPVYLRNKVADKPSR